MATDVLIRDGRIGPTDDYLNAPALEDFLASNKGEIARLGPDADLEAIRLRLPTIKTVLVEFPTFADGRGFSIARELRRKYDFRGELIAHGPLIPDQYAHLVQCGFDAVMVDEATFARQSDDQWRDAVSHFDLAYQRGYSTVQGPATSVFDARETGTATGEAVSEEADPFLGYSAQKGLREALKLYGDEICLVTSMGVDSAVLLHMLSEINPSVPVIFLDTGKHFRETLTYRDRLVERLGLTNFQNVRPDPEQVADIDPTGELNASQPDLCCQLRKVMPLDREIGTFKARITGRKRYQTPQRADMPMLEPAGSEVGKQAKVNPLAYWQAKDVTRYMRTHDLPPHPLLALGYLSIGCQPCTTRVAEGEDPRAGRWRGQGKTECGIHYIDGKWVPTKVEKTFEVF